MKRFLFSFGLIALCGLGIAYGDGIWSGGGVIGNDGIANKNAVGVDGIAGINAKGSGGGGGGCAGRVDLSAGCALGMFGGL